ncbi:MAG: DUF3445 domain-containing protein [Ramlibacter sp.]|nr:DUF3445 domain-containing protein [Ramlibacter sp.]
MSFDLSRLRQPFRMEPGLRRMAPGEVHLSPLAPGSALYLEKQRVFESGQSRWCVPGFDPQFAIQTIADHARQSWATATFDAESPLELVVSEDLAVLDGASGTVPWLCVCTPSHWAPEDKLGQSLARLHGPVADNARLLAATDALVRLVTAGEAWERHVWTVSASPRHDQHPARQPRDPWPEPDPPAAFAARCFLRVERQTFLPVPGRTQAVFTIRVSVQPLTRAVASPEQAASLAAALRSMSPAVLEYKGLTTAQPVLLRWLASVG